MKKYKCILMAAILLMSAGFAVGQISKNVTKIATIKDKTGWIQFKDNLNIDPAAVFTTNKNDFGLNATDNK